MNKNYQVADLALDWINQRVLPAEKWMKEFIPHLEQAMYLSGELGLREIEEGTPGQEALHHFVRGFLYLFKHYQIHGGFEQSVEHLYLLLHELNQQIFSATKKKISIPAVIS
jgi:hypothetical protein